MRRTYVLVMTVLTLSGCSGDADTTASRQPAARPVSVLTLTETDPDRLHTVTGVVGSWKVEDIGFEVSGRVVYTIEPETNVMPPTTEQLAARAALLESGTKKITDAAENVPDAVRQIIAGTSAGQTIDSDMAENEKIGRQVLARIDPVRYRTAVASAVAQIETLKLKKKAAEVQRDQVLKTQRDSAVATEELARGEFERAKGLKAQGAITQAEYNQFEADYRTAAAQVAQVDASKEAQTAEIASFSAQIEQAGAALDDAAQDLRDCVIYAPFRGQVAEVNVIPGGTVARGEPVVRVQMMDPMKIEFEVSAQQARQMHYKNQLAVHPAGSGDNGQDAVIWMTDAAADPSTRTFTVTLLIRNQLVPAAGTDGIDADSLARTRDTWKLIPGLEGQSTVHYVEQHAIHRDDDGEYVWKVNPADGSQAGDGKNPGPDILLDVEKVRVTSGSREVNFLGLWTFRDVRVNDPSTLNLQSDRVLGRLKLPAGQTELTGNQALLDREEWMLRPGDLVGVDLQGNRFPAGIYVPIDAISEKSGKHYVFVVEPEGTGHRARQVEVSVSDGPDATKRIAGVAGTTLTAGLRIVLKGVHYLTDGEAVNVTAELGADG